MSAAQKSRVTEPLKSIETGDSGPVAHLLNFSRNSRRLNAGLSSCSRTHGCDDWLGCPICALRAVLAARGTAWKNAQIYFLTSLPASISDNQPNAAPSTIDPTVGTSASIGAIPLSRIRPAADAKP